MKRKNILLILMLLFASTKAAECSSSATEQIERNPLCKKYSKEKAPYGQFFTESSENLKLEFVWIPGGCFIMGSESGSDDEKPEHLVALHGFYMGKYEITNNQYQKFNSSHTPKDYGIKRLDRNTQPAVNVSEEDARKYIAWLKERSSKNYRLPTEAEWEYAARGSAASKGQTSTYFWGDNLDEACRYANVADTAVEQVGLSALFNCKDNYPVTAPAGSFIANDYGLYDMIGNVWEWCSDAYQKDYYKPDFADNPQGPKEENPEYKVIRGGSWNFIPWYVRTSGRYYFKPNRGNYVIGFRLVLPVY